MADAPQGIAIRDWDPADFPAIQQLSAGEGWPTPKQRPEEALLAWRHSCPALVAVAETAVVGFLRGLSDGAVTIYVAELLVAPDWRGRGIARALLDEAQRRFPGARLDLLATAESSAFYERIGFRPFAGYRRSGWPPG